MPKSAQSAENEKLSIIPLEMGQISRSAISLPGGFARAVRLREMALAASLDVPRYLLAPEIAVLLDYLPDLRQRMLIRSEEHTSELQPRGLISYAVSCLK